MRDRDQLGRFVNEGGPVKTNCAHCGKGIERIRCRAKERNYCGSSCQLAYEYAHGIRNPKTIAKAAHQAVRDKPYTPRPWMRGENNVAKRPEVRKKISEGRFGSNNPAWKEVKARPREPWLSLKHAVKKRDNHQCQICGYENQLEVHHLKPWKDGGKHEMSNLSTLCHECHWDVHKLLREAMFSYAPRILAVKS